MEHMKKIIGAEYQGPEASYTASCSCGWVDEHSWRTRINAEKEWQRHVTPLRGIWSCTIGETVHANLPPGSDAPMREAVRRAYHEITGEWPEFIFSGWHAELTTTQQRIVDQRRAEKAREY